MPFDNAVVISSSNATLATVTTAVNTALAAEIASNAPQPVQVFNVSLAADATLGFGMAVLVKFQA